LSFLLMIGGILASGCSGGAPKGAPVPAEAAGPAVEVVAVRAGVGSADAFMTYLEPAVDAPVIARSDGIVEAVLAQEGQRVRPASRWRSTPRNITSRSSTSGACRAGAG
jgi:multidrug efflux pump subunit AcrA (membrane-fusion protein)